MSRGHTSKWKLALYIYMTRITTFVIKHDIQNCRMLFNRVHFTAASIKYVVEYMDHVSIEFLCWMLIVLVGVLRHEVGLPVCRSTESYEAAAIMNAVHNQLKAG